MTYNGMTYHEIARFAGVRENTVRKWRREYGMPLKPSMHCFLKFADDNPMVSASIIKEPCSSMVSVYMRSK